MSCSRFAFSLIAVAGLAIVAPAQDRPDRARAPTAEQLRWLRSQPRPAAAIDKVLVELNGKTIDIGDLDVTLGHDDTNGWSVLDAKLTLDPTKAWVKNWIRLHWVQLIDADACPATYADKALPMPQVDPAKGGWDYMYKDKAARKVPNLDGPNYAWFIDDDPWYYSSTGEGVNNVPGVYYSMQDAPAHCSGGGATSFKTWLVAEGAGQSMCLIAGFSWSISSDPTKRGGPHDLGAPAAVHKGELDRALDSSLFTGWSAQRGCGFRSGLDLFFDPDPTATPQSLLKLNVLGPPSGFGAVFLAAQLQSGIPLSPWGVWYLDPATSMLATVLPLDGKGVGSLSVKLPAARFPALTAGAQVATFRAADFTLTNWAAFANWANATGSEIATARFDGARDVLQVSAKGMPYATALDVTMRNPGGGWIELGTFKTPPPPTLIAWTKLRSGLRPGGEVEVWRGSERLLRLR